MKDPNTLWVVETSDGQAYIGRVEITDDNVVVRSGFQGRPAVVAWEDVEDLVMAQFHPDVRRVRR